MLSSCCAARLADRKVESPTHLQILAFSFYYVLPSPSWADDERWAKLVAGTEAPIGPFRRPASRFGPTLYGLAPQHSPRRWSVGRDRHADIHEISRDVVPTYPVGLYGRPTVIRESCSRQRCIRTRGTRAGSPSGDRGGTWREMCRAPTAEESGSASLTNVGT